MTDETALHQAGDTIMQYMHQAVKILDDKFGEGYAGRHPQLLGAMIQAQTDDYNNASMTSAMWECAAKLSDSVDCVNI